MSDEQRPTWNTAWEVHRVGDHTYIRSVTGFYICQLCDPESNLGELIVGWWNETHAAPDAPTLANPVEGI